MANIHLLKIFQEEIEKNLSQLLMVPISELEANKIKKDEVKETKYSVVYVKFTFSTFVSHLYFYLSTELSTLVEHLMLGAMMDRKTEIDDEILDAIKEVISTITGNIATSINNNKAAKSTLGSVKFEFQDVSIKKISSIQDDSMIYDFKFHMNNEEHSLILRYDKVLEKLFDEDEDDNENTENNSEQDTNSSDSSNDKVENNSEVTNSSTNELSLSKEAIDNLKLLFDIELKVSVRLGTKKLLLRDIVKMDIGHIIELDQLVSENLDILLNGVKIAEGSAVVIDGKFGIQIKHIGSKRDRINQLKLG